MSNCTENNLSDQDKIKKVYKYLSSFSHHELYVTKNAILRDWTFINKLFFASITFPNDVNTELNNDNVGNIHFWCGLYSRVRADNHSARAYLNVSHKYGYPNAYGLLHLLDNKNDLLHGVSIGDLTCLYDASIFYMGMYYEKALECAEKCGRLGYEKVLLLKARIYLEHNKYDLAKIMFFEWFKQSLDDTDTDRIKLLNTYLRLTDVNDIPQLETIYNVHKYSNDAKIEDIVDKLILLYESSQNVHTNNNVLNDIRLLKLKKIYIKLFNEVAQINKMNISTPSIKFKFQQNKSFVDCRFKY